MGPSPWMILPLPALNACGEKVPKTLEYSIEPVAILLIAW